MQELAISLKKKKITSEFLFKFRKDLLNKIGMFHDQNYKKYQ